VELAFDHLFDVGLDDDEAQRIALRFKRARTQILPIFSQMVVSPFERERSIALAMLARLGGQATAKMLETILADEEIHDAFKLDVRRLREQLAPDLMPDEDDEDELDEAEERAADDEGDEADVVDGDETPAALPAEDGERERPARRRRRAGRQRGRRDQPPTDAADAVAVTVDPQVFEGDPQRLLPYLSGPLEPVLQAFGEVALPKRLSFVDRSGRLTEPTILAFLLPLLQTDEWALVQSALRAIGQLGFAEALEEVEKLAADSGRKRVKLRAERVRDQLLEAAQQRAAEAPAESVEVTSESVAEEATVAAAPADEAPEPRTGKGRSRPQPKRRGRDESSEPARAEGDSPAAEFGILTIAAPERRPPPTPPLQPADRLPRLGACLASGIGIDGGQRLLVFRQTEADGDEQAWDRLEVRLHAGAGWVDLAFTPGLGPQAIKLEQEAATALGESLVEVTVGYVRGRLSEACDQTTGGGLELPAQADAALQFVGSGRKQDLAASLPEAVEPSSQDAVEQLLNHPLFAGWRLPLAADGGAVQRWEQTTGKRSASRVRRRLIDDVTRAWYQTGIAPAVTDVLLRQALLLQRAGQDTLAQAALGCAASLTGEQRHPERHLLLRELVYRGFQTGLDLAEARRERFARAIFLCRRRAALARSAFQRGLRRR